MASAGAIGLAQTKFSLAQAKLSLYRLEKYMTLSYYKEDLAQMELRREKWIR